MNRFLYNTLAILTVIVGIGFSTPLLADAGQFKLDMILAKRGDADAQYYVANAYEEGRGTDKDIKKAFAWYNKAATQNHAAAQYKMGVFYENGQGVEQDIKKAMDWYKKAADGGNSMAKERLNKAAFARSEAVMKRRIAEMKAERIEREKAERERKLAEQRSREAAERKRQEQARAQAQARAKARAQAAATDRKEKSARTARQVNIPNIVDVVLNNKWHQGSYPADYLPSSSTHCLRASDSEVVCFSSEKQRVVKNQRVTYTAKATLSDFQSDGSFQVRYNYNAVKLDDANKQGQTVDPHGLKPDLGWQQPQLALHCKTTDKKNLYCSRGNLKLHYSN